MRRKVKKEIEVDQVICDGCKKEVDDLSSTTLCDICRREYCKECSEHGATTVFSPSVMHIPTTIKVCKDCLKAPISNLFDIYTSKQLLSKGV